MAASCIVQVVLSEEIIHFLGLPYIRQKGPVIFRVKQKQRLGEKFYGPGTGDRITFDMFFPN